METQVTDLGLLQLKAMPQLRSLFLTKTQVTDAGLVHLKRLTKLYHLNLDNTNISDTGLEHLKGLPELMLLSLNGTKVTDAGAKGLQNALPNCKVVHVVPPAVPPVHGTIIKVEGVLELEDKDVKKLK
jgi:internalin A